MMQHLKSEMMVISLILLLMVFSGMSIAGQKHDCKEVIKTKVENREFITGKVSYGELKKQVVQQALLDAVKQSLGTEVRTHSGMSLKSVDGDESERFNELTAEKAKGFIKSYKITKEEIVDKGKISLLEIGIAAEICVPKESELKELVVIGDFISDDKKSRNLRKVMMTSFPTENKHYSLVSGHPDHVYHDIKIQGRLMDYSIQKESKKDAQRRASNSKNNLELFGKLFKQDLNKYSNPDVRPMQTINVQVVVEALLVADQELISETVSKSHKIPAETSHETTLRELTKTATAKASEKIYDRLLEKTKGGGFFRGSNNGTSFLDF